MRSSELDRLTALLGPVRSVHPLAGGYSYETCLLDLPGDRVVVRLGGAAPEVEAAVLALGRTAVPVPAVRHVLPGEDGVRAAVVLDFVEGTPLGQALDGGHELGAEVGEVIARIGTIPLSRPGFFTGPDLAVAPERPWSAQLPEFAEQCLGDTTRLDRVTAAAWLALCREHAPALTAVDGVARLVHADVNPKNLLIAREGGRWRVRAVLDWEFAHSGCPYGDAANMLRFARDYPPAFTTGFRDGFGAAQPDPAWPYLGRVLDMFALTELLTRPPGNPVADQAAARVRWLAGNPSALETG
ncbi:aminoglycoside phosphotransferase (APT) family kinase protein [Crossiella equi]|uniref:Aminoglycoside phosphotransferase (APT) family kinase protein n=1 Tax=Crossiella equi TaxID=130796 RepID=A0ABS5APL5_9PSEU|nr:phosphotransferase [Crossiella equi]MBP2478187.1 aminoglycoside phosphotransferase (APT) family kinase protein [Crossiella equi]